ncbi:unnamed protein product, partial [Gulo gulo]
MRPPASGSARAWRCACARWRRRTVRCGGSSAWRRGAPQPTATATTPRPTPWKRVPATARTSAPASWLATALSAGSSRSWRSVRQSTLLSSVPGITPAATSSPWSSLSCSTGGTPCISTSLLIPSRSRSWQRSSRPGWCLPCVWTSTMQMSS